MFQCLSTDTERTQEQAELKGALIAAQDSAIAQLLLEICLNDNQVRVQYMKEDTKNNNNNNVYIIMIL